MQRLHLLDYLQGCNSVNLETILCSWFVQPDVLQNYYINAFQNLTGKGGRKIAGPMLVLQGTGDPIAPAVVTDKYVNLTCSLYPDSAIEYMTYEGVGHVPVMFASQQDWLGWIKDRFVGKMANGCQTTSHTSARPQEYYQQMSNWFVEFQIADYETA